MINGTRQLCLIVMGMHRSGTSALSRVINLLGAQISSNLIEPAPDNASGFWEPLALADLDDRFLSAAGSSWFDPRPFKPGWMDPAKRQSEIEQAAGFLEDEFAQAQFFTIKDPRLSRLFPIWLAAFRRLEIELYILIACRNPLAVSASLQARNNMNVGFGGLLWLRYMLEAEASTRVFPRIIVHYEHLLEDWRKALAPVLDRLALSVPMPDGCESAIDNFLDPNAQHHAGSIEALMANNELSDLTKETYRAFRAASNLDAVFWQNELDKLQSRLNGFFYTGQWQGYPQDLRVGPRF